MSFALVWFRRDLRLFDNPALHAALTDGHAPIPLYVHAPEEEAPWSPGAASHAWLARSLTALDASLRARGSRLIVRFGPSAAALDALLRESGACAVYWSRLHEPATIARDRALKAELRARGIMVRSENAALLREPWTVQTRQGTAYRVFTPYWRQVRAELPDRFTLAPAPASLPAPPALASLTLAQLGLMPRPAWDRGFWTRWQPGEDGAEAALSAFLEGAVHGYADQRDLPERIGTSRLSPHLHFGEISPRQIWNALGEHDPGPRFAGDVERYRSELGWREFSHHLLYHFPHSPGENLDRRFDGFAWEEPDADKLRAWQRGRTGIPIIDAGMRELWHTGWMHNRVRMLCASFLCKNLRYHWQHGARWFWDTLLDADLANNTQGWQWAAGTGADAAPYFRIFSPVAQTQRFDPHGAYIRQWCPELARLPDAALAEPWSQPRLLDKLAPDWPMPIVDLAASRSAALNAWQALRALTPRERA